MGHAIIEIRTSVEPRQSEEDRCCLRKFRIGAEHNRHFDGSCSAPREVGNSRAMRERPNGRHRGDRSCADHPRCHIRRNCERCVAFPAKQAPAAATLNHARITKKIRSAHHLHVFFGHAQLRILQPCLARLRCLPDANSGEKKPLVVRDNDFNLPGNRIP